MKTTVLADNIFYIENAFPESNRFIKEIEEYENDPSTYSVIPQWQNWYDSRPYKVRNEWKKNEDAFTKGKQKLFDWDITATDNNKVWPRPETEFNDDAHKKVRPTIDLIDKQYLKLLDIWYEKTGNKKLEYISKNYFLRKYHIDGEIGPHVDKNADNPLNTMDWSVLFYLNDNYEGGEIYFPDYDITIKPSAGSAIFFPCTTVHVAKKLLTGEKYYIFMVIHSEFNYSTSLSEPYHIMNNKILKYKNISDHPILNITKEWAD